MPYGAHPTACRYFYDYDPAHLNHYKAVARDDETWAAWLEEWVYGVESRDALPRQGRRRPAGAHQGQHGGRLRAWSGPEVSGMDDVHTPAGAAAAPAHAAAYTPREMMAIAAGRLIKDGDVLFAGTGVAMLAATVAKRIHAPRSHIFFETGGIGPTLEELPMAVADPRVMAFSNLNAGLVEAFSYVANRRLHTVAFLGAAQIDRFGNMNSTVIGDYQHPTVRFSGSGGACDAGSLASGYIVFMQHGVRKFVDKLDYLTTPGWLSGRRLAPPRRLRPRRPHRRGHRPLRARVRRATRTRCTWRSATKA